ncbi:MAG: TetR/AcrR family transcriptional regulator [Clostridia bacterium]
MENKREKNAEKTKQNILQAAEEQFAELGFYGARIDVIAQLSDINKRMIYEYFQNKENLYKQVLFHVYKRMEIAEAELLSKQMSGIVLIRATISMYFDFLQSNPTFVSILMWENLNKARYLNELDAGEVQRPTIPLLANEIRLGKERGIFKSGIDENQLVISLITICYANFSNCYTLSTLFGIDLLNPGVVEARKQHTIDIILAYMCP